VRLATVLPSLGAPEGAVVAAFERIDLIASDVVAEVVAGGVEPDRALADHAFAHRLVRQAGTLIMVGPGPLVVAPDLTAGLPSDPATRAGRALALQLIGVALARGDGLPAAQIVIDPVPAWLVEEPEPAAHAIAEVAIRRSLFPGHPFGFVQPPPDDPSGLWGYLQAAATVHAGEVALVLGRPDPNGQQAWPSIGLRTGATVGREVAAATTPGSLAGSALVHARAVVSAAAATLDGLAHQGWRTVAGDAPDDGRATRGPLTTAERTEAFDPFEGALGRRR
jgi:hypothetical protein